jgi:hypothetical protein
LNLAIADDETGFKGKEDVFYRTEGWDFFMAGGAAYNNLDYSFTARHPDGTLIDFKSPGGGSVELRRSLGALKKFMEGLDLVQLKPMNGIVKGGHGSVTISPRNKSGAAHADALTIRVLGKTGEMYAVYIRGGSAAEFSIELPKSSYTVAWINPKNGEVEKRETFEHAGGEKTLASPPYTQDIALRITAVAK